MASNEAQFRLNGRILRVGGGTIDIEVSLPGLASTTVLPVPATRSQEEWAGVRLYRQVNLTIDVKAES